MLPAPPGSFFGVGVKVVQFLDLLATRLRMYLNLPSRRAYSIAGRGRTIVSRYRRSRLHKIARVGSIGDVQSFVSGP
jgi:hypothetical protein